MGTTTYVCLLALGLFLIGGSAWTLRHGPGRRSLTTWIIAAIGLGIAVGATFRKTAPEVFEPKPAEALSAEVLAGPVPAGTDASLRLRIGAGADAIALPWPAVAADFEGLASAWRDPLRAAGLRTSVEQGRLVLRAAKVGVPFEVLPGPAAARLGLEARVYEGRGTAKSLVRDSFDFLRNLFLNALRMTIVPVIFTSIMSGMLSLGTGGGLGRLGAKTVGYYMITSVLSIVTGLLVVNLIQPGIGAQIPLSEAPTGFESTATQSASEFLFGFVLGLIPVNPVQALASGNVLQAITFTILLGFFITRLPESPRALLTNVFEGLFQAVMLMVRFLLWLAPVGVFAIFVKVIAETGPQVFADLGLYALAVLIGLLIHALISLPALMVIIGRLSPWRHAQAMTPALLTAFSTSSSSATMPLTMRCLEKRAGVSNRVTSFVLPLGTTVNMDGTALYECVAAVFIAQIYITQGLMEPLTAGQQVLVVVTSLAASIGAAGVPMAGMVMIGIILNALGLPLEGIGYIIAVDRLLDMCRTAVNVWSNAVGAAVIAKSEGETSVLATWPPADLERD